MRSNLQEENRVLVGQITDGRIKVESMNFTPSINRLLGHYGVAEHHGSIRRRAREQFADVVYVFVFGLDVIVLIETLGHWMLRRKIRLLPIRPFRRQEF
jgi:hypothetical protein